MESAWSVLGIMGRNLVLNMADHGYAVAGYDKDQTKVEADIEYNKTIEVLQRGKTVLSF